MGENYRFHFFSRFFPDKMKQFFVLTLFPEMIEQTLSHSIMGRAQKEGHISVEAVNIRDFTQNKHKHVDDYPMAAAQGL